MIVLQTNAKNCFVQNTGTKINTKTIKRVTMMKQLTQVRNGKIVLKSFFYFESFIRMFLNNLIHCQEEKCCNIDYQYLKIEFHYYPPRFPRKFKFCFHVCYLILTSASHSDSAKFFVNE